jgi:hypothetical protein
MEGGLMSPVPVIELQRRLTLVGAIRGGGEKQPKAPGRKLEAWRITSPRQQLVEQAAALYGGQPSKWQSPVGDEWQVYTEAEEIPVLVMPSYSLRQTYELWEGATKCVRRCDGIDEDLTQGPCICNAEGIDKCDLYTRLVVALPELDTVLGWRVITRGSNAGHEIPTMMALAEAKAAGQTFVPARLRLDQRRGVKDGQVVRFVVPTLDLGVSYSGLALSTPTPNGSAEVIEAGTHTPVPPRDTTLRKALEAAQGDPAPRPRRGPAPAAFPPAPPITSEPPRPGPEVTDAAPTPSPEVAKEEVPAPPPEPEPAQTKRRTEPQAAKLNVLVGKLREAGHIATDGLYSAIGGLRSTDAEVLVEAVGGRDFAGQLHWAPLRDDLTRSEATQLIEWLTTKEQQVGLAQAQPAGASSPAGGDPGPDPTRPGYNEFPPGY